MTEQELADRLRYERGVGARLDQQLSNALDTIVALRRELAQRDALIAGLRKAQAAWIASPEAAARLDGYRELAAKCADLECQLDEAKKDYAAEKSKHARTEALRHEEQVRRKRAQEELQVALAKSEQVNSQDDALKRELAQRDLLIKELSEDVARGTESAENARVCQAHLVEERNAALAKSEQRREAARRSSREQAVVKAAMEWNLSARDEEQEALFCLAGKCRALALEAERAKVKNGAKKR